MSNYMSFILSAWPIPKDLCSTTFGSPVSLSLEYNFYVHWYFLNLSDIAAKLNKRYDKGLCPVRDFVCCCLEHLNILFDVSISS